MKTFLAWSAPVWFMAFLFSMISYGTAFDRGYDAGLRVVDVDIRHLTKTINRLDQP